MTRTAQFALPGEFVPDRLRELSRRHDGDDTGTAATGHWAAAEGGLRIQTCHLQALLERLHCTFELCGVRSARRRVVVRRRIGQGTCHGAPRMLTRDRAPPKRNCAACSDDSRASQIPRDLAIHSIARCTIRLRWVTITREALGRRGSPVALQAVTHAIRRCDVAVMRAGAV